MDPKLNSFFLFLLPTLILCLSSLFLRICFSLPFSSHVIPLFLLNCTLFPHLSFPVFLFFIVHLFCFSLFFIELLWISLPFSFSIPFSSYFHFAFPFRFSIVYSFDLFLLILFYSCLSFTFLSFRLNFIVSILGIPNEDRTYYSALNDLARQAC